MMRRAISARAMRNMPCTVPARAASLPAGSPVCARFAIRAARSGGLTQGAAGAVGQLADRAGLRPRSAAIRSWLSPSNAWRTITCAARRAARARRRPCGRTSRAGRSRPRARRARAARRGSARSAGRARCSAHALRAIRYSHGFSANGALPSISAAWALMKRLLDGVVGRGGVRGSGGSGAAAARGSGRRSPRTPARHRARASATRRSSEAVSRMSSGRSMTTTSLLRAASHPQWDLGLTAAGTARNTAARRASSPTTPGSLGVRPLNRLALSTQLRGLTP